MMTNFIRVFGANNELSRSALFADTSLLGDVDFGLPVSFQWFAGNVEIATATSDTLLKSEFSSVFDNEDLSVTVSYTNTDGAEVSVSSANFEAQSFYMFVGGETGTLSGYNPLAPVEAYSFNGVSAVESGGVPYAASPIANITAVSAGSLGITAREGDNVLRFYADSSSYPDPDYVFRTELDHSDWGTKYAVGDDFYSSYSFLAPSDEWDPVTDQSIIINQWKQYSSGSPAFAIRLSNEGDYKVTLESLVPEFDGITLLTINPDEWVDVKTFTHFSKGTDGILKIWINGKLVFDYTGQTMIYSSDYGYNTLGMYTEIRDEREIYFDAIEFTNDIDTDFDTWLNNRNHLPEVDLSGVTEGQQLVSGSTITLTADAFDPGGAQLYSEGGITQVEFFSNGASLGIDTSDSYGLTVNLEDGAHVLTAVATDSDGNNTTSEEINIFMGNRPPVATLTGPAELGNLTSGSQVQLTATASDPDGTVDQVEFFVNNVSVGVATIPVSGTYSVNWTPPSSGAYEVSVVATDNEGGTSAPDAVSITADAVFDTTTHGPLQDAALQFSGTTPTSYGNFGDVEVYGSPSSGKVGLVQFDLTPYLAAAEVRDATLRVYVDTLNGPAEFSLFRAVGDNWDETAGSDVSNAPSRGDLVDAITISAEDQFFEFDVSTFVADMVDTGATLITFWIEDVSQNYERFTFDSQRGDQLNPSELVVTTSSIAAIADEGDAVFTISGDLSVGGTVNVAMTGSDPDGDGTASYQWQVSADGTNWNNAGTGSTLTIAAEYASHELRVLVSYIDGEGFNEVVVTDAPSVIAALPNVAPTAADDSANVDAGSSVLIDVLDNDSDSDGTLNTGSIAIVANGSNGTAAVESGQVRYTPDAGFSGTDTFTYTVLDDDGAVSNTATVTVSTSAAPNVAPTDITLDENDVDENSLNNTVIGSLIAMDTNVGDTHTFQLIESAGGRFALDGSNLIVADGLGLDYETDTQHTIIVRATDTGGLSFEKALTINVNDLVEGTTGTQDDDVITTGVGGDNIALGGGNDILRGILENFYGDSVDGFGTDDEFIFEGAQLERSDIVIVQNAGGISFGIDSNDDGVLDGQFIVSGDFSDGDFMALLEGTETHVTFETFLPALVEGQAVNPSLVNGIINQEFLTGDGSSDFQVTLRDMGLAGYNNVVGVYEIDASGNIVDTRILFQNVNADRSAVAGITDVEAGNKLGFFLVQNAASWAGTLAAGDLLSFVNGLGAAATISDGSDIFIAVNGNPTDEMVFHSFNQDMNSDGVQHALSGVDPGGESITVGFEDLTGGGDRDYEDVVFHVEVVDDFLFV